MAGGRTWEGPAACRGKTRDGLSCSSREIDGLEFCLQHVPDELLPEAEMITGMQRCRHAFGEPGACQQMATAGTEPPACLSHGANAGSVLGKRAARNEIEQDAIRRLEEIMAEDANQVSLLSPPPIDDPLQALLDLAAEIRALRKILRDRVMAMKPSTWRYAGKALGEQVRAEIILYERAQEREASILVSIVKLKIEDRLAKISQRQVEVVERALDAALEAAGLDLDGQDKARRVLHRELAPSMN